MGEVSATPTPLLVYDRIDANRRKARLLLILFAVALPPAISGFAAAFIVPWVYVRYFGVRTVVLDADHNLRDLRVTDTLAIPLGAALVAALVAAAFLISRYGSRVVLRGAHAQPVDPGQEPDLAQVVEHLCIGAGLPLPRLYVIESAAPNAFATGRNPHDASLVVTRGLLGLLDRRELEGVIAHELSHIGNHDIRLSTTLAAVVGTLSLPLRMLSAPFNFVFRRHGPVGVVLTVLCLGLVGPPLFEMVLFSLVILTRVMFWPEYPSYLRWWAAYTLIAPSYAVFGAPVVALRIRQAVSRQREFLADADAVLLTRDPEGLALALAKIGAVGGEQLRVGEGTVRLYFVDPLSKGSWLHAVFPSHPSLEKRVELLARMGSGIAPSAIQAARDAGAAYVFRSAPLRMHPAVPADHALTPLYEQPDGWSRVLAQLPESAVVTPIATDGQFIRVTTAEHQTDYVVRSAPLTALKSFQP